MQFWQSFVKAGKAIFTLENSLTGERYTYKVSKKPYAAMWFVGVLAGPDNTDSYRYIGFIYDTVFDISRASKVTKDAPSFKWFDRLNDLMNNNEPLAVNMKFYHANNCGRCGKLLTVPASVEAGFGPECILYVAQESYTDQHIDLETAKQIRKLMQYQAKHRKLVEEGVVDKETGELTQ